MQKPKKVTKLVIPLAGFGTRFLPISKNYPKEMVGLVDRPVIQYLIEEAVAAGIREVIFVLNYSKQVIPDYFSKKQHPHQARVYRNSSAAKDNLQELQVLLSQIKFYHIKKSVTLGDGHSILFAKSRIEENESFAVSMGDLLSPPGKNFLKELIAVYKKTGRSVVSVESVSPEMVSKYGVVAPKDSVGRRHTVSHIIEKPDQKNAPSTLILTGKYILDSRIFSYLQKLVHNHGKGEVRLADALNAYAKDMPLDAYACDGKIQDTGNKLDFLKATVTFGLAHSEYGKPLRSFLKSLKL